MSYTVQAIYPAGEGKSFDWDYYMATHIPMVREIFGRHQLTGISISEGIGGPGPGVPPGYFAITTMRFPDESSLQAALAEAGPLLEDIPNFTTTAPEILIGKVRESR